MIEIVERLRELERVIGDMRGLAGSDRALDGRIRFRTGQQQLPEVFLSSWRLDRFAASVRVRNRAASSPRSASFFRIFRARTAAYCT